jgi:hypothetical protein
MLNVSMGYWEGREWDRKANASPKQIGLGER